MSKRERILLRVERGALVPADAHSQQRLREKGYRVGDVLAAELAKPRSAPQRSSGRRRAPRSRR